MERDKKLKKNTFTASVQHGAQKGCRTAGSPVHRKFQKPFYVINPNSMGGGIRKCNVNFGEKCPCCTTITPL